MNIETQLNATFMNLDS